MIFALETKISSLIYWIGASFERLVYFVKRSGADINFFQMWCTSFFIIITAWLFSWRSLIITNWDYYLSNNQKYTRFEIIKIKLCKTHFNFLYLVEFWFFSCIYFTFFLKSCYRKKSVEFTNWDCSLYYTGWQTNRYWNLKTNPNNMS